ncbi:MAG: hypothetical protein SX243_25230 [Acidobacteriota bacterium]|nr:hypothetical protein [Acidobacteriota bacterium]
MKTTLALLFAIALLFTVAPGAFADDAQPAQDQQVEVTQVEVTEAPAATADAELLEALNMEPLFAAPQAEPVCHPIRCEYIGCPYQYPTCLWNGCCG